MQPDAIEVLTAGIRLGEGHEDQERVVAAALRRLLVNGQRGVVLADEVGFGKTYEALAVVSNLCAHARLRRKPFERVLVLCKPSLVRKWEEETSSTWEGRGFPRYLANTHPARRLFAEVHCIDRRAKARKLRSSGLRGQRVHGQNQVPPGLYVVNERLLQEERRQGSTLLRQMWRTYWDVVIVDEAHHYAHGNAPMRVFAPDGVLTNYEQPALHFSKILALTATPFELTPQELVSLLALVKASPEDLKTVEDGLQNFVRALDRFFGMRQRSPTDPLREQQVALLEFLRDKDALKGGATDRGLQSLLRRYLVRNTKSQNERKYFLVERQNGAFACAEFRKLDEDLQQRVRRSPLIPFEGEHALFYLELRELIQEVTDQAREGDTARTFIPTDLRQGLSSYRQMEGAALLTHDLDNARRLKKLVTRWNKDGRAHPKVAALSDLVRDITKTEIAKVRATPEAWFSKILVFNKLIRGTAPQLTEVLGGVVRETLDAFLDELLGATHVTRDDLAAKVRRLVDERLDAARVALRSDPLFAAWRKVPDEFEDPGFERHRGRSLLQPFRVSLQRRSVQPLALIDLVRAVPDLGDQSIERWIERELTWPVVAAVRSAVHTFLDDTPHGGEQRETLVERAERALVAVLEECKSVGVVGRFDGENAKDREAHRRNFNRRHNPFVLLVGQVGEEGIDLQEQCRYVIHYDLEWNPARMEQREGRVDRMGWGRAGEGFIDVRFLLLDGTYEERIFHTVMQRDQWFQVLIGSKKREMGQLPDDIDDEIAQDRIKDDDTAGGITEREKRRVMLDLRPE